MKVKQADIVEICSRNTHNFIWNHYKFHNIVTFLFLFCCLITIVYYICCLAFNK